MVLHNIRSVYNVGSVFRTCDAANVDRVYLVGVTPTPMDRFGKFRADFAKVALGAEKTVEWEHFKNFGAVYKKLKSANGRTPVGGSYKKLRSDAFEILAVEQGKRSIPYYFIGRSSDKIVSRKLGKVALVFGEETKGLPKSVLDKCDKILEIPMRGKKESLNVSVAAGIVIYHLMVAGGSGDFLL